MSEELQLKMGITLIKIIAVVFWASFIISSKRERKLLTRIIMALIGYYLSPKIGIEQFHFIIGCCSLGLWKISEKLTMGRYWIIRYEIAQHENLPLKVLEKLTQDADQKIREKLVEREKLPPEILDRLTQDSDWEIRKKLAMRNDLPSEILQKLAQDKSQRVCRAIAERNDLPSQILNRLALDKSSDVCAAVADKLSPETLQRLSQNKDEKDRQS